MPFGALVFGRLGDLVGRKNTFLVTMWLMGASTFPVGLLPSSAAVGVAAPILLVLLRLVQGLALGGEYGGAATYVAEHAPEGRRGLYTSFIQTTATLGLFAALLVVIGIRTAMGEQAFAAWGWRIPFLISIVLLGVSLWIRLQLAESPAFLKMKAEGRRSKAPIREAFGEWGNLKIVLIALFGAVAGQAVVWYAGRFYALFFVIGIRTAMGEQAFAAWGWRIPVLISIVLLGVSLWIRLQLAESPAFLKMKAEGRRSKAPIREAFGEWGNLKIVLIALFGAVAGQAVVWYAGQFYALFFLEKKIGRAHV